MLDGIRDELGPEEALDDVEQPVVREQAEDCRADVERRVGGDVLLRQADVEGLVKAAARSRRTGRAAVRANGSPAWVERNAPSASSVPGDLVEDPVPLGVDRGEVGVGVEDVLDDDVAFLGELRADIWGHERHRGTPLWHRFQQCYSFGALW